MGNRKRTGARIGVFTRRRPLSQDMGSERPGWAFQCETSFCAAIRVIDLSRPVMQTGGRRGPLHVQARSARQRGKKGSRAKKVGVRPREHLEGTQTDCQTRQTASTAQETPKTLGVAHKFSQGCSSYPSLPHVSNSAVL